jgi:GT2 family glycosyltransferase
MGRIVAVVVTYNRSTLLVECIEALKSSTTPTDCIVIDNASTDGTQEVIKAYIEDGTIAYYNTGSNLGGAGGFNYGMKKAYEAGYDYIWLLDDDTIVKADTLTMLLDVAEKCNGQFGFLSSMALWTDGSVCSMNYHETSKEWNQSKLLLLDGMLQIQSATFVSFLVNRKAVEKLGYPIKDYFIWGDDTEYSLRISREFPCYFVFNSQVIHKMKSNQGTAGDEIAELDDVNRINRLYYSIRNDWCTGKRYGIEKLCRCVYRNLKSLGRVWASKGPYKRKKTWIILKGTIHGIFFNPKIEYPK